MRGLLILLTIGSAVWSVFATATYFAEADSPNVTIIQQIAVILMTGLSSISLIIGVAGIAILNSLQKLEIPATTSRSGLAVADSGAEAAPTAVVAKRVPWWADKNNPIGQ